MPQSNRSNNNNYNKNILHLFNGKTVTKHFPCIVLFNLPTGGKTVLFNCSIYVLFDFIMKKYKA